jgi:hypothetical protein
MVAPLVSFPWLYFGITQKAWAHGDPGPAFMDVPISEIALSFVMTFLNTGVWLINYGLIANEANRGAESKDSAGQEKEDNPR